jgi:CheY-like chemotaxis protein
MAYILVIDDDPQVRLLIRLSLEEAGHEVAEASQGNEGTRSYAKRPADLVLCDLFMPEKEGLETIRELRSRYPDVRVIAISGGNPRCAGIDFLPIARSLGALAVLPKPFETSALRSVVENLLHDHSKV